MSFFDETGRSGCEYCGWPNWVNETCNCRVNMCLTCKEKHDKVCKNPWSEEQWAKQREYEASEYAYWEKYN